MPFNPRTFYGTRNSNFHKEIQEILNRHPWIHSISEIASELECSRAYVVKAVHDLESSNDVVTLTIGNCLGVLTANPPENNKRFVQWNIIYMAIQLQTKDRHSVLKVKDFPSRLAGRLQTLTRHTVDTFNLKPQTQETKEEVKEDKEDYNPFDDIDNN